MAASDTASASSLTQHHLMNSAQCLSANSATSSTDRNNSNAAFDPTKALKNYAANMAMSAGLYWPGAAAGFPDSSAYAAAAYTQASALAVAASNMQNLTSNSG